jgi:ankyrin repeat protein
LRLRNVVELLLEKGADVNAKTARGEAYLSYPHDAGVTPLHEAVACGEPNLVQVLIAHGAEINAADESGRTPLHYAVSEGDDTIVRLLITKGANIDVRDKEGMTPLLLALHYGYTPAAKMLMAAGAEKVTIKNTPEWAVLHGAFRLGNREWVQLLLENGAMPDELDENGDSMLHVVARQGDLSMAKMLIAAGADVNIRNPTGATPLHYAAAGRTELASLLLTGGADVSARANNGDTPLHDAALRGNREMVELLLAHGADASVKNSRGRTPRDEAVRRGHADLVPLLTGAAGQGDTNAENEDPGK